MTLKAAQPLPKESRNSPSPNGNGNGHAHERPPITRKLGVSSLFECIGEDLSAVEEILRQETHSEIPLLEEICGYVHDAGGKRLRPALVLLSCRVLGSGSEEPFWTGAAVEMIHAATLLHDDVVDSAKSRRGRLTVSEKWSRSHAIIAGNMLLTRAFGLLVRRRQTEALRILSGCMLTMCRGEILQNLHRGDLRMSEETYYKVIRAKTADFLSACCRAGALLAGESKASEERLAEYGMNLGLSFQVTDDLLDVCGDEAEIGKPLGGDLREGKMTLPLILGLNSARESDRNRVMAIAQQESISTDDFEEVRAILMKLDAPQQTRRASERFTQSSLKQLEVLPMSPARQALEWLALSLSTRTG